MTRNDPFLERFFGEGNGIRWRDLHRPHKMAMSQELEPFLALYDAAVSDPHGIAVLPRRASSEELRWYILTRSAASARHAVEVVTAYLGASYSDVGERSGLAMDEPIDRCVAEAFGPHCFSVRVTSETSVKEVVRNRLAVMAEALRAHPRRGASQRQTVGRVLRTFEQALESRDEATAETCLEELKASGHLDAVNRVFLELRLDAAFERWSAVLDRTDLLSILDIGVPRKVARALLQAVFETELVRFETEANGAAALEHFSEHVEPRFRPLYRTRAALAGYEVDAQFLLCAALRGHAHEQQVEQVLGQYESGGTKRAFLDSIARQPRVPKQPGSSQPDPLKAARDTLEAGDVDRAYELAVVAPPSPERAAVMLSCATERDMPDALAAALRAHAALSDDARVAFGALVDNRRLLVSAEARLGMVTPSIASGGAAAAIHPVVDWSSWLRRLTLDRPWPAAITAAAQGETQWSVEPLLSHVVMEEAARILRSRLPDWSAEAVRDALPCMVNAWLARGPSLALKPLLVVLSELLPETSPSLASATALARIMVALVELGRARSEYAALLEQTAGYLGSQTSPTVALVALEALETLADLACPDPQAREKFARVVGDMLHRNSRHIDPVQMQLFDELVRSVGMASTPREAGTGAGAAWAALSGTHIALYSPSPLPLDRASALLRFCCPDVEVSIFSSPEASAALKAVAQGADVFVLAWGCSDRATTCIHAFRSASRPKLLAPGKGASALLEAVGGWLGKSTVPLEKAREVQKRLLQVSTEPADEEGVDQTDHPAVLAEVGMLRNRLEPKLRIFIKRHLMALYGDHWVKHVLDVLPAAQRDKLAGVDADKILNERLMFTDLIKVMDQGWDMAFKVLESGHPSSSIKKSSMRVLLEYVTTHREDAHAKPISHAEFIALGIVVQLLERAVDKHIRS